MRSTILLFICSALSAAPSLHFTETAADFGPLLQGDVVSHVFAYENRGHGRMVISKVSTSCGCTAGEVTKKELAPGEKGELKVTFNSDRFTGPQKKTVTVCFTDRDLPCERITISAEVKKLWDCTPPHFNLSLKTPETALSITNLHSSPIRYIHVEASMPDVVLGRKFPVLDARVVPGGGFACPVKAVFPPDKMGEGPRYGYVEVKISFEDGRSFSKKIGVTITP